MRRSTTDEEHKPAMDPSFSYSSLSEGMREGVCGPGNGIETMYSIKVLVVPCGNIPSVKFRALADKFSKESSVIEHSNLTFQSRFKDPPFHTIIGQTQMHFQFVETPLSRLNPEWNHFHAHRRVMAVVAICHCPSSPDLSDAYREFQAIRVHFEKNYGPARFKCFAFEPLETQADPLERADFFMIPNQADRLGFYINTCMTDLASQLLGDLEAIVKEPPETLTTPLDQGIGTSRQRKLMVGRVQKYIGDHCLLAGVPFDAVAMYNRAMETLRSNHDYVWLAGTMECKAAALCACDDDESEEEPSTKANTKTHTASIAALYSQVYDTYEKTPFSLFLTIEAAFHLARYYVKIGDNCMAAQTLFRVYQLREQGEFSAHDQIAVTVEAAVLCQQIGFYRQFAFYLMKAADIYGELNQFSSCYTFQCLAAPVYKLEGLSTAVAPRAALENKALLDGLEKTVQEAEAKQMERGNGTGRWVRLQQKLLEDIVAASKHVQDNRVPAFATAYLLRMLHPWLDRQYQRSLAADLWSLTAMLPLNSSVDLTGIPIIVKITPLNLPCQPFVFKKEHVGEDADLFAYRPGEEDDEVKHEKPRNMIYVANETLEVEVLLKNPLKFELVIQRISLSTSGVPFESFPSSLTLLPGATSHVLLPGKCLSTGTLSIRGCHIRTFNLMCEHLVDDVGEGCAINIDTAKRMKEIERQLEAKQKSQRESNSEEKVYPRKFDYKKSAALSREKVDTANITVISPLPQIVVRHKFVGSSDGKLLIGEERRLDVSCDNVGTLPIDRLEVSIKEVFVVGSSANQDTYYTAQERVLMDQAKSGEEAKSGEIHTNAAHSTADAEKTPLPASAKAEENIQRMLDFEGEEQDEEADMDFSADDMDGIDDFDEYEDSVEVSRTSDGKDEELRALSFLPWAGGENENFEEVFPLQDGGGIDWKDRSVIQWDAHAVQAALPLLPGAVLKIPIMIRGHMACKGAQLRVRYAESANALYERSDEQRVTWDVDEGLVLLNVDTAALSVATNPTPRASNYKSPYLTTLHSLGNRSSPARSRFSEGPGEEECLLVLEIQNTSPNSFSVTANLDGEPGSSRVFIEGRPFHKQVVVPMKKITLPEKHDRALREKVYSNGAESSEQRAAEVAQLCQEAQHIVSNRMELHWRSGSDAHGTLGPVNLSLRQLLRLLRPPYTLTASLNSNVSSPTVTAVNVVCQTPSPVRLKRVQQQGLSPRSDVSSVVSSTVSLSNHSEAGRNTRHCDKCNVGELSHVFFTLTNETDSFLDVIFILHPTQKHETADGEVAVSVSASKLLWIGCLEASLRLPPGGSIHHEVTLCFVSIGRYELFVSVEEKLVDSEKPAVPLTHRFPTPFCVEAT